MVDRAVTEASQAETKGLKKTKKKSEMEDIRQKVSSHENKDKEKFLS